MLIKLNIIYHKSFSFYLHFKSKYFHKSKFCNQIIRSVNAIWRIKDWLDRLIDLSKLLIYCQSKYCYFIFTWQAKEWYNCKPVFAFYTYGVKSWKESLISKVLHAKGNFIGRKHGCGKCYSPISHIFVYENGKQHFTINS